MTTRMNWCVRVSVALAVFGLLLTSPSASRGQKAKPKELGGADDRVVEIQLGKTPKLTFLFWSGEGIVVAQVRIEEAEKPEMLNAKIVSFARLWKAKDKKDYEYRTTPQIKAVPF